MAKPSPRTLTLSYVPGSDQPISPLTEGNGSLTAYGTLTVSDSVARNVVTTSVTSVMFAPPSRGTLTTAEVLGFLTATSQDTSKTSSAKVNLVFDSGSQKFDFLAQGEVLSLVYTVTASNGKGGTANYTFTVQVTGTNDGPTLVAGAQNSTLVEAGVDSGAGNTSASIHLTRADVDGIARFDPAGLNAAGWSSPDGGQTYLRDGAYGRATLHTSSGVVSYQLDNARTATQALAQGATAYDDFTVQVTDGLATASTVARFTITGTNDAPTVTAGTPSATLVEAGEGSGAGISSASIQLTASDVDGVAGIDAEYLLAQGWTPSASGLTYTREGTYGTATLNTTDWVVSYQLDNERAATQALMLGDSKTEEFDVRVTDGSATASAVAQFVVLGTNEVPVVEPKNFYGTENDDTFTGGELGDSIFGVQGNDTLHGVGGDDYIVGGDGNDYLTGGDGNDQLIGGAGDDTLYGEFGADILRGGAGNDVIYAGDGNNVKQISGDAGLDTLFGGAGSDGFEFGTAPVAGEWDAIFDFTPSQDLILMSASKFGVEYQGPRYLTVSEFAWIPLDLGGLTEEDLTSAATRIVAREREDQRVDVYYDLNGGSPSDAKLFATLTTTTASPLASTDFYWFL